MPTDSRAANPDGSVRARARRWMYRRLLRGLTGLHLLALRFLRVFGRRPRPIVAGQTCEILLTGTFYSENWIAAHVRTMAASERCRVRLVTTFPLAPLLDVVVVAPPAWLKRLIGDVSARLVTFGWLAIRTRPHWVGGFHLLVNGLVAAVVARLAGSRSLYFCVGGAWEILDGGIHAENRLFGRLQTPDKLIEQRFLRSCRYFNLIVTMGTKAVTFFREHGIHGDIEVVPGGIHAMDFCPTAEPPTIDLILVGRLAEIKRIDIYLEAVARVRRQIPSISAVVVGEGQQRGTLERLAGELSIDDCVKFVGHQTDVRAWLNSAKLFLLTSDSEGLALSLMEAMTCGLPVVVSDVGDLADLVRDGVNGFLVPRRDVESFAHRIVDLISDPPKLAVFSAAARRDSLEHEASRVSRRWTAILRKVPESIEETVGTERSSRAAS